MHDRVSQQHNNGNGQEMAPSAMDLLSQCILKIQGEVTEIKSAVTEFMTRQDEREKSQALRDEQYKKEQAELARRMVIIETDHRRLNDKQVEIDTKQEEFRRNNSPDLGETKKQTKLSTIALIITVILFFIGQAIVIGLAVKNNSNQAKIEIEKVQK